MIKHVVVWKLKNFDSAMKLKKGIEDMAGKVPGLLSIEAGIDNNRSDAAGDLVLISTHKDKNDLEIYQAHPIHQEFKEVISGAATNRIVVDYII